MSKRQRASFSFGVISDSQLVDSLLHSTRGRPWMELILGEGKLSIQSEWYRENNMSGDLQGTLSVLADNTATFRSAADALSGLWPIVLPDSNAESELYFVLASVLKSAKNLSDEEFLVSVEKTFLKVVATVPKRDIAVPESVVLPAEEQGARGKRKLRSATQRNLMYLNGLAESALSALALLFTVLPHDLDGILLNLMVDDIDRSTGRDCRYCTLSVQVTRAEFEALDLKRVEPVPCLKSLKAVVPSSRTEVVAVRPIIEFDKADHRIVEAEDLVSALGSRPNLMELTPTEFETLIQNLFSAIGLDTHQTQASRDGGVDCIAYDNRPIFGGKIIIQAKRYRNVVGVSAVRDLYGTVMNEGASKGILVTTSHYGKAAYEFAKDKPLELLEGPHLLHLLREHTGLDARILVLGDWVESVVDL